MCARCPDALGRARVLWREPKDIVNRNLFYGPGGEEHQPHSPFTFESEDLEGTTPKFVVRDAAGVKWKIKLGPEARPETVATRLIWAVGFSADEDYLLDEAVIAGMPKHLHRGQKLVGPNGVVRNVRFKRVGRKKIGNWQWRNSPFTGTYEFNGLRALMAVINNWDLKDVNNAIRVRRDDSTGADELVYEVSDLGSSFGTEGLERTNHSIGSLQVYRRTSFIKKLTPDDVDFSVPRRAPLILLPDIPQFFRRLRLLWIGRDVPREDARWIGDWLAHLSSDQIRDAFRAGGYSPQEIEGFAAVVESRISELKKL
jgi:hypothetical protein